jgi:excinuclease UvrABC nuclease subunit
MRPSLDHILPRSRGGLNKLYNNDKIIYIGKSNNIKLRVACHKKDKNFNNVKSIIFKDDGNIDLYEVYLINKYKPILNKEFKNKDNSIMLPEIILN